MSSHTKHSKNGTWCCLAYIVYYNKNDINLNSNTNTYSNTGGLFRFGYERVYKFLTSVHGDTRRETQFLKAYVNHTMLTPLQRAAHLVMFKISINLCRSRSEKLNCRKPNYSFNGRMLNYCLFKILKFSGPSLLGMTSSTVQPISCLGVYYDKWWLSYPLRAGVRLYHLTMHLDKEIE